MVGGQYVGAARWRAHELKVRRMLLREIAAAPRPPDGLLCSFPRSGRQMVRFALLEYLRQMFGLDEPLTFRSAPRYLPNLAPFPPNRGLADFAFASRPEIPLIACSHWNHDPAICADRPTVLVLRDPRDALVSYHRWVTRRRGTWAGSFQTFIRTRAHGIPRLNRFLETWSRAQGATVLAFEDWTADPPRGLERALRGLGLKIDPEIARKACDRMSFDRMQALERAARDDTPARSDPDLLHVRRGARGGWRSELSSVESTDLCQLLDRELSARARRLLATAGLPTHFAVEPGKAT